MVKGFFEATELWAINYLSRGSVAFIRKHIRIKALEMEEMLHGIVFEYEVAVQVFFDFPLIEVEV